MLVYLASVYFSLREKRIMNYELRIMNRKVPMFYSLFTIFGFLLVFLVVLQRQMLVDSQMAIFIGRLRDDPGVILDKLYVVGKFFQTLFNLTFGWLYSSSHEVSEVSHGVDVPLHVLAGILTFLAVVAIMVYLWRKKRTAAMVVSYFIFWIVIFSFPSWFFVPSLIAAYPHRYLVLPSVGFIVLVAYGISQIKKRMLVVLAASLFVVANIYKVHMTIREMGVFRSNKVVESVWTIIDGEVLVGDEPKVFMYLGEDPAKTNILDLSGAAPFALRRKYRNVSDFPIVSHDTKLISDFLCSNGPLALDRVYAWDIKNSGEITSVSVRERLRLKGEVERVGCRL